MAGLHSASEEGFVLSLTKIRLLLGGKLAGAWSWSVDSIYRREISWTNTNERHICLIFQTPRVRTSACGRDVVPEDSGVHISCRKIPEFRPPPFASTSLPPHRTPCSARNILKQLLYVLKSANCRWHCARCLFTNSERKYQFCAALRAHSHDRAKRNTWRGI